MFEGKNWSPSYQQEFQWAYSDSLDRFTVQRDDLIHPIVSGNKSRKLLGWIAEYQENGYEGMVTFGGAYSNHLIAVASVCQELRIPVTAFVRGDEGISNPYLNYCQEQGMELVFTNRDRYRNKSNWYEETSQWGNRRNLVIPEGGMGVPGLDGFRLLIDSWGNQFPDIIVHASATGTTAAGLRSALNEKNASTQVLSILVLRNAEEQRNNLKLWGLEDGIELICGFEFGGYAKKNAKLIHFLEEAMERTQLPLEPVYTGKAFYALIEQVLPLNRGKHVCFLHTGGVFKL